MVWIRVESASGRAHQQWSSNRRFVLGLQSESGRHNLAMIDVESPCRLGFRTSVDSSGATWNPAMAPVPGPADYPSLAIASNGTLVIGYNTTDCVNTTGFRSVVSTNGGQTWSGPFPIVTGSNADQAFGRIVAVGDVFYYLYSDRSSFPTFSLKCKQSGDGINWGDCNPAILDTYTAPNLTSPCTDPSCSTPVIYYAPNIDAAAASGLGWVLVYPAARTDDPSINNMKFCAQNLGCTTILFRFSWKWRRRSPSKVKGRTHEEAAEALHAGRESRHP